LNSSARLLFSPRYPRKLWPYQSQYAVWLLGLACASLGAGVHSAMDPFDGFRDSDQNQGIYEHVFLRRWIRSLNVVRFAHMWEWVIQAFATIWFIAISANLSQLIAPGWQIATGTYFAIWFVSAIFDVHIRAKGRQAKELAISTISHHPFEDQRAYEAIFSPIDLPNRVHFDSSFVMSGEFWK
jgi:hypothetical protein